VPGNSTTSSWMLSGGLGNDTYSIASTNSAGSVITDTGGVDTLVLTGGSANISGMNSGGTLASMGIDALFVNGTSVVTVGSGQLGSQAVNAIATTTGTPAFTLAAGGGVMSVASLVNTQIAAGSYLSASGVATTSAGVAPTGYILVGSTSSDTITGSSLVDTITGGTGVDLIDGGAGNDSFLFTGTTNTGVATAGAASTTTTAMDVYRVNAGDTFNLALTADVVATTISALQTTGNVTLTITAANLLPVLGIYSATANTFTVASVAGGANAEMWLFAATAAGTTATEGIILVGVTGLPTIAGGVVTVV